MSPEQAATPGRVAVQGAAARRTARGAWVSADPSGPAGQFMLNAVAVASAELVWAVGQTATDVLIERWDGAGWSSERLPPLPAELIGAVLQGVSVSDRSNAVAVGGAYDRLSTTERPLAYHYNGLAWESFPLPDLGAGYVLTDVAHCTATDIWATGALNPPRSGASAEGAVPLVLHWNGGEWRQVSLPEVGAGRLVAVAAGPAGTVSGSGEVWAVGVAGSGAARRPLVLRYDGRSWSEVALPASAKLLPRGLSSVAVAPDGRVWVAGSEQVLQWDGVSWRRYDAPLAAVNALTATPSGEVWIAGAQGGLAYLPASRLSAVEGTSPASSCDMSPRPESASPARSGGASPASSEGASPARSGGMSPGSSGGVPPANPPMTGSTGATSTRGGSGGLLARLGLKGRTAPGSGRQGDAAGFEAVSVPGVVSLWSGAAATDSEDVWLVGSRQGFDSSGPSAAIQTDRPRHLITE